MKSYSQYTPVSLGWVDKLPAHWKTARLKQLLFERKENNNPIKTKEILSLTNTRGVIPYAEKGNIGNKSKEKLEDYHLAYPDDLILNSMNVIIGSVGVSRYFGAISPVYYALVSRGELNIKYSEYIFRLSTFEKTLEGLGNGILDIRKRIPMIKLNNVILPVPPRPEQDQIVRFLDWKVSSINRLINIKRAEIKRLEELKLSRLFTIVTQGLNEKVELIDSGIEHIGLIPSHWKVLLNHRIYKENCRSFSGDETVLSLSQKDGLLPYVEMKERSLHTASYENWKLVLPNDLVLNRFKAHLGVFFSSNYRGIVTFHYGVYEPIMKVSSKYYEVLFHTSKYKQVFAGASNGMTVGLQNLSNTNFYKVYTVYPPYEEQCAIVAEVQKIENEMQAIISTISKEIGILHEFKTRLISDVVTGKIDVRDIEIPEYEFVEETENVEADSEGAAEEELEDE